MVESQPSKLLVASSILVSRSKISRTPALALILGSPPCEIKRKPHPAGFYQRQSDPSEGGHGRRPLAVVVTLRA